MTTYYVGPGGNNANPGTSWANRKLTLNGAEDIPVAAGDTVYVGPGTYRELLTVDVAGTAGNPITYIGDYTGENTDGVGGIVRITGSDNDQTAARGNCISLPNNRSYRTFRGFVMDVCSSSQIFLNASSSNLIVEKCCFPPGTSTSAAITINGTSGNHSITNCFFHVPGPAVQVTHSSTVNDMANVISNCIVISGGSGSGIGIRVDRVGGVTVKNCAILSSVNAVRVVTALAAGQTLTVNNCLIMNSNNALAATVTGELVEDYNAFFANANNRSNVNTGANSLNYPPLFDVRWFFQLLTAGAGPDNVLQVISPFDLSSFSQLLNVAGTSPTSTDIRGTSVQGSQREWGALEYDSTLKIKGGSGSIFGGIITR